MTAISIAGMGLTGVLRITWVQRQPRSRAGPQPHRRDLRHLDRPGLPRPRLGRWVPTWTTRRCSSWPPGARSPTSSGKPPTSSPPTTPRYSRPPCARITAGDSERAEPALGEPPGHLVAGLVSELRGARVHAGHGPDPVRAGQAPALGGRLLRAPHQPSRPSPSSCPQHRPHQLSTGGLRRVMRVRSGVGGRDGERRSRQSQLPRLSLHGPASQSSKRVVPCRTGGLRLSRAVTGVQVEHHRGAVPR